MEVKEASMSAVFTSHDKGPRDLALAAIKEALGSVGQTEHYTVQLEDEKKGADKHDPADVRNPIAKLLGEPLRARIVPRRLAGLLGLVCIGVAVLAWQSSGGQVASEPISTSSVPIAKKEGPLGQPSPNSDLAAKKNAGAQVQPQGAAPTSAPAAPELTHQIQAMAHELATVAQGIDQLKTEQSQIAHENAGLAEELKATDIVARHNAELAEDLKTAQSQLARQISDLTDQFKANQDLMTSIAAQLKETKEQLAAQLKETQERAARPASSEQRQRPKSLASSQPAAASPPRRTTPRPVTSGGVQTQLQPKQQ